VQNLHMHSSVNFHNSNSCVAIRGQQNINCQPFIFTSKHYTWHLLKGKHFLSSNTVLYFWLFHETLYQWNDLVYTCGFCCCLRYWIWTQGLHFEPLHQPYFLSKFFQGRISQTICPVWLQTLNPPELCLPSV
jgi:hypothetical protein